MNTEFTKAEVLSLVIDGIFAVAFFIGALVFAIM